MSKNIFILSENLPGIEKRGLQEVVIAFLDGNGMSQRKFAKLAEVSETTYGGYRRGTSPLDLPVLDKILPEVPGLAELIIDYLLQYVPKKSTDLEKHTAATNEDKVASLLIEIKKFKAEAEKFRKAADALARVNLINSDTIAQLTSGEVIE